MIRHGQMPAHALGDGLEVEAGPAGPVAQCRAIEPDALTGIDFSLPIERQVIAERGDDDLGSTPAPKPIALRRPA